MEQIENKELSMQWKTDKSKSTSWHALAIMSDAVYLLASLPAECSVNQDLIWLSYELSKLSDSAKALGLARQRPSKGDSDEK